jgi:transcriptional regulator with XRE-family HTH domain
MDLIKATKELRERLGITQQEFAHKLGLAISSVTNYERVREPTGRSLAQLMQLADEHGHADLAKVFNKALSDELGLELPMISGASFRLRRDIAMFNDIQRRIAGGQTNEQIVAALKRAVNIDADSIEMIRQNMARLAELGKEAEK